MRRKDELVELFKEAEINSEFDEYSELGLLGFDSIKLMELIVLIEEKYDIEIADNDLVEANFRQVKDLINLIDAYVLKKKEADNSII